MPPARATAAPRRQPGPSRTPARGPRRLVSHAPRLRVRWERLGRIGLLLVLAIVVGLYAEHALSYLHTRAQANQQQAIVSRLARQNARLKRERRSLNDPTTIVTDARRLGMVRPGELSYVITGPPSR